MNWRSRKILERPEWSMHRSLFKAMGYSDYDLDRPLIGIANSWNRAVPGHANLNQVSEFVKQGIHQAGGTPVAFGGIAACDGIAQGHDGMHFILRGNLALKTAVVTDGRFSGTNNGCFVGHISPEGAEGGPRYRPDARFPLVSNRRGRAARVMRRPLFFSISGSKASETSRTSRLRVSRMRTMRASCGSTIPMVCRAASITSRSVSKYGGMRTASGQEEVMAFM
jgi:Dehydratase family